MDELATIRAFLEAIDSGSFSSAARRLNTSTSSVARQVKALEDSLGVRLLNRTTRQQSLTEAGRVFYERTRDLVQELGAVKRETSSFQDSVKGMLRVSLRVSTGSTVILPALPAFLERHPGLTIDVSLTDERPDLVANEIDVAVWLGHIGHTGLIARRLTPSHRLVCGSPSYFRTRGVPEEPGDLGQHNCLVFRANDYGSLWRFSRGSERIDVPVSGNLRTSSGPVLLSAALSGLGVVVLQEYMVRGALRDGSLRTVLSDYEVRPTDADTALYAVYPHSRGISPKARAFVDFLVALFKAGAAPAGAAPTGGGPAGGVPA